MALISNLQGFKLNDKSKSSASAPDGITNDFPAKFSDNLAADVQAKPDSACIDLLRGLDVTIQLKQLGHVFLLDAGSCVSDSYFKHVVRMVKGLKSGMRLLLKPVLSVYHSNFNLDTIKREHVVNKYTAFDNTLPKAQGIKCPNTNCPVKSRKSDIRYIKYDDNSMKYIYMCLDCNQAGIEPNTW